MQKTILIVEDEVLIAMDLEHTLQSRGWRVIGPAPSVQSALQALEAELPTVAILDVSLGSEFVTPVALALRSRGIPFVVASAFDKPEEFAGEVLAGAANVGKPTSELRLFAALAVLVPEV